MKLVGHKDRAVEITGVAESKKMTIRADPRMFKNLLGSIYSEKEKTVVRELMANGFDSHIKAGCGSREIEVFLPTAMEPNFIVRDFGTGMNHQFMMEMYSDIGFSTKQEENESTGMFGVGSKSPMAITDTFVVKAYDADGIRQYMVVIPADEHPEINFTFQVYKEGENYERGIEVIVPIDNSRREAVLEGLASQHFCWFDKPVKFHGALDEIKHKFYTTIAKINDGLYLATPAVVANARGVQWNVFVRQGAAVYPLVETQIERSVAKKNITLIKHLCQSGRHVLIDLPVGTANVTLAREAIQYDTASTTNIGAAINKCFDGFYDTLTATVGDAIDYKTATERLADKFFLDKKERGKLMSQKLANMLVKMTSSIIEKNYDTWHVNLPLVPEMVQDMTRTDGVIMLPSGKMIPPPYLKPRHEIEMFMRDFPEGKVLLHKGTIFAGYREDLTVKLGGTENNLGFSWPNVVFVIPSHLKEWKQRVEDYIKQEYVDEVFANDIALGVPLQVIRCAIRNVDASISALNKFGVQAVPVTVDMLPGVPVAEHRKRNFSKTSVYPYNTTGWSEQKMEPDYLVPAYFVSRVGIAHDVWLQHPTTPIESKLRRRVKASSNDTTIIIREAREMKFIDTVTPIYRVTENQAKRIVEECPVWVHLPTHIFDRLEKSVHVNTQLSLGKSKLGTSYDNFMTRLVNHSKSAVTGHDERDMEQFKFLRWLCDTDPLVELIAACRHAMIINTQAFRGNNSESQLEQSLYEYGERTDKKAIAKYDKLYTEFEARYYYMTKMVDDHHSANWIPHAKMYLDNAFKAWQSAPDVINLTDFAELDAIRADFRGKLLEIGKVVDKREHARKRNGPIKRIFGDDLDDIQLAAG